MFFPEGQLRVFVYGEPVDMRCSFDGLSGLVRNAMGQNPMDGSLFAFINRRNSMIKVLYWDRSGWAIWSKRLEQGCFVREPLTRQIDWMGLKLLLEGIEPKRVRHRYKM
jgi:transposase